MSNTILLNPLDNVLVTLRSVGSGECCQGVAAGQDIPMAHKLARVGIGRDQPIVKLGQIIGFAREPIAAGDWVHSHNVYVRDFDRSTDRQLPPPPAPPEPRFFDGYHRADGRVGTRNYIAVMSSVNCSATAVRHIVRAIENSGVLRDYPDIDGIIDLSHGGGCSLKPNGPGYDIISRTQLGYMTHPNIGGAIMVGLGCEGFQIDRWMQQTGLVEGPNFRTLTLQEIGGTRRAVEAGVAAVRDMLPLVNAVTRRPAPASKLVLALQCGGSDGYSAITCNLALGAAVDLLVAQGGTAILSETPEIFGAEHLLIRRARHPEFATRIARIVQWWKDYTSARGMELDNNPSPGNKAGGLTTILEKSMGAVAKGGSTPLEGICSYAERVAGPGLIFMDTPGYDPVAATGQVAGGATVMCFTTGRGSAFGCKPTPSLKLASNSRIYAHMSDDMDIDCGDILDGTRIEDKGREIFEAVLAMASGRPSKSETFDYGDAEFIPWEIDAVM